MVLWGPECFKLFATRFEHFLCAEYLFGPSNKSFERPPWVIATEEAEVHWDGNLHRFSVYRPDWIWPLYQIKRYHLKGRWITGRILHWAPELKKVPVGLCPYSPATGIQVRLLSNVGIIFITKRRHFLKANSLAPEHKASGAGGWVIAPLTPGWPSFCCSFVVVVFNWRIIALQCCVDTLYQFFQLDHMASRGLAVGSMMLEAHA